MKNNFKNLLDTKFKEAYFNFFKNLFKFENRLELNSVDFQKPWWHLLFLQKWKYIFVIISEIIQAVYEAFFPLAIGFAISQKEYKYILYIVGFYVLFECINRISSFIYQVAIGSTQASIMNDTQKFFLNVDPIYHSTKSTGQISSKLQAGGREFVSLFILIFFTIIPVVTSYIGVSLILLSFDRNVGIVALGFFILITIVSSLLRYIHSNTLTTFWIKSREKFIANQVENLSQNQYIRSTFSTTEQIQKTKNIITNSISVGLIMNQGNSLIIFIIRMLYVSSLFWIGFLILKLVQENKLDVVLGTTMILTYVNGSSQILRIGDFISQVTESIQNMNDLWDFIRKFGKQTYPVEFTMTNSKTKKHKQLSISLIELVLNYNESTRVLNNHSLFLRIPQNQKNKLYGIIGPSGTGKTTLVSLLGGQLNPQSGSVIVGDKNIYTISDNDRRNLIAMQTQTATSIRGSVKTNLIFGLPDKEIYTEKELVQTLNDVGLWDIFNSKEGLQTLIGEGGINLSGGQRQRLNFAGLYLRAKHYKPSLILIDEPTSSLDEISEDKITNMIIELSTNALTLVVAHRLKTLYNAIAILDSSLIASQKELEFYTRNELEQKSQYYRDLISGKAVLED
jgi:ATP-binding cassette, subfamily B, bacterial AbcA/BmrA